MAKLVGVWTDKSGETCRIVPDSRPNSYDVYYSPKSGEAKLIADAGVIQGRIFLEVSENVPKDTPRDDASLLIPAYVLYRLKFLSDSQFKLESFDPDKVGKSLSGDLDVRSTEFQYHFLLRHAQDDSLWMQSVEVWNRK